MRMQLLTEPQFRAQDSVPPVSLHIGKFGEARTLAEAIVETIREPLLVLDEEFLVVTANRAFRRMFKVDRRAVQDWPISTLGGDRWNIPELESFLPNVLSMGGCLIEADVPGMGRRTLQLDARRLFHACNDHADRALMLVVIEDVSERRAGERQTAELLHQKDTLLDEMQHRMANSLQIIASILLMKARAVKSEEVRLHLKDTHQRIMSVAAVQRQLGIAGNGEEIELAPYLSRLCETLAAALIGGGRSIEIRAQVYHARIVTTAAVSIGLIVTELVINALKHAFVADTTAGLIVVSYEATEVGWRLAVSDNGIGLSCHTSKTSLGLGTGIVEALARQLDSRVDISMGSSGTSVAITHGTLNSRLPHAAWYQHPARISGQ